MAKNKKKLGEDILLTPEKPEKINEKQLKEVQDLINDVNKSYIDIGQYETKKHAVVHHIVALQEKIGKLRDEFEKEYGTADIDIQTGTINYPKENVKVNKED